MPLIADMPPKPTVPFVRDVDTFGDEGKYVFNALEQAERHWEDRAEWLLTNVNSSPEAEPESVPLKTVGKVKVRCRFIGPLKPMPYEWDE